MNIEDFIILAISLISLIGLILLIFAAGSKLKRRRLWQVIGLLLIICAIAAYFIASFVMSQLYPPPNLRYLILIAPNGFSL